MSLLPSVQTRRLLRVSIPERIAAIDLGSNSFHMVIARLVDGNPVIIDKHREMVRLAEGLDEQGNLSLESRDRALLCLERFGQGLRDLPSGAVHIVGTNTLRVAENAMEFRVAAEKALGHSIHVVSGKEEGRLIYLGVAHSLADDSQRRLVIDIGGGSTELILGKQFETQKVASLLMGCVSFSQRYFPKGAITQSRFRKAVLAAQRVLEPFAKGFRQEDWEEVVGASGTMRAAESTIQGLGKTQVTRKSLGLLMDAMVESGHCDELDLAGLRAERRPSFPGGIAIVKALFDTLEIKKLAISTGALREGLLYDLLGRVGHEDVRERSIALFQKRFSVDLEQATRVENLALDLFDGANTKKVTQHREARLFLAWAARLHEIGLAVNVRLFHRHGAYLVKNSDLPGFSQDEQNLLAFLLLSQRRRFPDEALEGLATKQQPTAICLAMLLRLALLFLRNRSTQATPPLPIRWKEDCLCLTVPGDWLAEHPLTELDLQEECSLLEKSQHALALEIEHADGA